MCFFIFCFRSMVLTLNITLQARRNWALSPMEASHAGTVSPWLLLTQGTALRKGAQPHRTVVKGESKAPARRIRGDNPLTAVLPPFLPLHLFLPLRWLTLSVCLREHKGVRHSPVCQFLLLWVTEDAAWQRQAGAWGNTQFSVNCYILKKSFKYIQILRTFENL